jgi:hypothetical protein
MKTLYELRLEACDRTASPSRLRELANDSRAVVRARVAENTSTPLEILELLSEDKAPDVRVALTLNDGSPIVLLWLLASDPCADVRFALADNPRTPTEILIWLTADDNPYVAWRAEKTIEAVVSDSPKQGGTDMSATLIERELRRALNRKERLSKADALRLREMVLEDGYLSRGERKVMVQAIENNLLDDDAFEIFVQVLLQQTNGRARRVA